MLVSDTDKEVLLSLMSNEDDGETDNDIVV